MVIGQTATFLTRGRRIGIDVTRRIVVRRCDGSLKRGRLPEISIVACELLGMEAARLNERRGHFTGAREFELLLGVVDSQIVSSLAVPRIFGVVGLLYFFIIYFVRLFRYFSIIIIKLFFNIRNSHALAFVPSWYEFINLNAFK